VTGCGYHGPPGDDRGSIPCPNCQREAFDQFFLTGGDWLHGTTFSAAYALVKGTS
jgi:hypothetical protein